jgi:hypothetical protein
VCLAGKWVNEVLFCCLCMVCCCATHGGSSIILSDHLICNAITTEPASLCVDEGSTQWCTHDSSPLLRSVCWSSRVLSSWATRSCSSGLFANQLPGHRVYVVLASSDKPAPSRSQAFKGSSCGEVVNWLCSLRLGNDAVMLQAQQAVLLMATHFHLA